MSRFTLLAAPIACLWLNACSTLVTGTGQQIAVTTPDVAGVTCQLTGGDGVNAAITAPATVHVPKSKKDIEVTCSAPRRAAVTKTVKSTYSDWSIVEHPLGYPIDAATGAMWVYPKTVVVAFADPEPSK